MDGGSIRAKAPWVKDRGKAATRPTNGNPVSLGSRGGAMFKRVNWHSPRG